MDKIQSTVMEACLAAGTIVSGPRHSFVLEKYWVKAVLASPIVDKRLPLSEK